MVWNDRLSSFSDSDSEEPTIHPYVTKGTPTTTPTLLWYQTTLSANSKDSHSSTGTQVPPGKGTGLLSLPKPFPLGDSM